MSARPLILVGCAAGRRVRLFEQAALAAGRPLVVLDHGALLKDPERLLDGTPADAYVRIDAAYGDPHVRAALLRRGRTLAEEDGACERASDARIDELEDKELLAPRQLHLGFLSYLHAIDRVAVQRPGWHMLSPVAEIERAFDKNASARWFAEHGVPHCEGFEAPRSLDAFWAQVQARQWRRVFIKTSFGSSASGLAVLHGERGDARLFTTLSEQRGRWFNSLRMRRLERAADVQRTLAYLLREGCRVERQMPKARQDGRYVDLRVLSVAGDPCFSVVRQSPHPITNLHLGGGRGDGDAFRRRAGTTWARMRASCRVLASASKAHQLGFDVLFSPDLREHRLIEVNAFGDLLPGLLHEGRSVYETELARLPGEGGVPSRRELRAGKNSPPAES